MRIKCLHMEEDVDIKESGCRNYTNQDLQKEENVDIEESGC